MSNSDRLARARQSNQQHATFEPPAIAQPVSIRSVLFRPAFLLLLLLLVPQLLLAQDFQPQFKPSLHISRTVGEISIDGELDDEGWRSAAVAENFAEVNPGDQIKPPVDSKAWITYDDMNLYVALIAYDDPSEVRVSLRERDHIFSDDYFGVMLDTYGDQSQGYEFFVNPLGIQGDLRIEASGNEDSSFDIVWWSEGKVTDSGFQVELAIPFSSLRFPDTPAQTWRMNFWRNHQRDARRQYAWSAINRDEPCWMCQWGTVTGIENVQPGRNIDVIGSLVGTQAGSLSDTDDPTSRFDNQSPEGQASLNLRYGLTSNAAITVAINPDFSQIESDAGRIDVNSTFALYYPERRPFFQEGSNLYDTWINTVYTRSINDPIVAGKLTGRFGNTSVVYTVARDEKTPMIVPFEQYSEFVSLEKSTSNLLRVRQSLYGDSHIGALVTDRRLDGGGSGTTMGGDARLRFLQKYSLRVQAVSSHTAEPDDPTLTEDFNGETFDNLTADFDGQSFWGHAIYANVERDGRFLSMDFDYEEYSPRFRTDNGFTTRNDYRSTDAWTGVYYRPNKGWLLNWGAHGDIGRVWNYDWLFKDEWLRSGVNFGLKGPIDFSIDHLASRERFSEDIFPGINIWSFWVQTRQSERLTASVNGNRGMGIYRDFDEPELARQSTLSANATFKPTQRLQIEPSWNYAKMDSRERDENLYEGYILRTRIGYNFTREWLMRLVLQYNEFSDRFDVEPLLTYRVNPFTVFYLGSTSAVDYYGNEDFDMLDQSEWKLSRQQFFTKIQYLYQF